MEEERRLCYVGMTRAEKQLYLSHAKYRRRFGGAPPEPSIPSRFLREVPRHLIEPLTPEQRSRHSVDLYAEQASVRQAAQKNLYTGKTFNSLDHINQFFAERGKTAGTTRPVAPATAAAPVPPKPAAPPPTRIATPSDAQVAMPFTAPRTHLPVSGGTVPPAPRPNPSIGGPPVGGRPTFGVKPTFGAKPAVVPVKPGARRTGLQPGATVVHGKYGRGTILKKEGDGDDAKLTVSFPGYGLKVLVAKFAGLKQAE